MRGQETTDAVFIPRQLQEKYSAKSKNLFFAFVDLEKPFDRVPRKVIWWAMRKLEVEGWIVYRPCTITPGVRVDNNLTDEKIGEKIDIH